MKKTIVWIIAVVLMLAAIILAAYPFISDYVQSVNVRGQGVAYKEIAESIENDEYSRVLESARNYNADLVGNTVINDPFATVSEQPADYSDMLRVDGTDVMAAINIPKIDVNLPIYHGTSDEILKEGVGHLSNSSLPVGGTGTHCILTGHTGYSQLKLFSDVDQLEKGDVFFINVLKETLAYRIYDKSIVLPEETESLQIDPNEDYCTLVTCYPFGVNTHRLLIRGTRIALDEGESLAKTQKSAKSTWNNEYIKAIVIGIVVLLAILLVFFTARFIIHRTKQKQNESDKV